MLLFLLLVAVSLVSISGMSDQPPQLCTFNCRLLNTRQPLRLHLAMFGDMLNDLNVLTGSWFNGAYRNKLIACDAAGPFESGGDGRAPNELEMFFVYPYRENANSDPFPALEKPVMDCQHNADEYGGDGMMAKLDFQYQIRGRYPETSTLTFGAALSAAAARSTPVVVSTSLIPDFDVGTLEMFATRLRKWGVSPERTLVLHYDIDVLGKQWADHMRWRHAIDVRAPATLPHHAWWNDFWQRLAYAGTEAAESPECAGSKAVPVAPHPKTTTPLLILGGDAHSGRQVILRRMDAAGVLTNASWSLAYPPECQAKALLKRPSWRTFCRFFPDGKPKTLDRRLEGEHNEGDKAQTFPPAELYDRTTFSVVFGSSNTELAPTEKVMKPLYRGHPFVVACGHARMWEVLHAFGFASFEPLINHVYDLADQHISLFGQNTYIPSVCSGYHKAGPDVDSLVRDVKRLVATADSEWAPVRAAAAHNRRHFRCPDGFRARLTAYADDVLHFVAAWSNQGAQGATGATALEPVGSAGDTGEDMEMVEAREDDNAGARSMRKRRHDRHPAVLAQPDMLE